MYDTDIGNALRKACQSDQDNGTMHLAEAARLVRKDILNINMSFNGSFEQGCQEASVPKSLVTFIHMILEGSNIEYMTDNGLWASLHHPRDPPKVDVSLLVWDLPLIDWIINVGLRSLG